MIQLKKRETVKNVCIISLHKYTFNISFYVFIYYNIRKSARFIVNSFY